MASNASGVQGILLEAGTNELELLVFNCGGVTFGINVAKVKEIIRAVETINIPCAPPSIEGSFKLREDVLSLVNLATYLELEPAAEGKHDRLIIIMEMNNFRCGILIDSVEHIHRIRWEDVEPPSGFFATSDTPITAVAKIGERVVQVLDFETITASLFGLGGAEAALLDKIVPMPPFKELRVLAVDDSPTIRMTMGNVLKHAGFENVTLCSDGQDAWERIEGEFNADGSMYDLVLSDIEMPRMDGLHLTQRIKRHPELAVVPVILFSSIIRAETINKGKAVGANGQITKFDVEELVSEIVRCIKEAKGIEA
tara:strand:- start:1104 stop:2039 length:936 start_codon:yes stop_codon:yes gene_type:complete